MNKKIYIGVCGIIANEGKILFIKKARGPYKGTYDLPKSRERGSGTLFIGF